MRACTGTLAVYLNSLRASRDAQAFVADCFTFKLLTGAILTYTNADLPVTLNGYVYTANSILVDGLRAKCTTGLSVDQQQITIAARQIDTIGGIPFLQAVRNGVLDGAEIQRERAFLRSWSVADLAAPIGSVILFKGRVGSVDSIGRTSAEITVNSDLVLLDLDMPRNVYAPNCQHVHYDSGCGLVKSGYSANGVVGAGSSGAQINWSNASSVYAQGAITFTSGPNTGARSNIKAADGAAVYLSYPLQNAPTIGDAFTVSQGCDHTMATCKSKFNNLTKFRGFPYVPSPMFAY